MPNKPLQRCFSKWPKNRSGKSGRHKVTRRLTEEEKAHNRAERQRLHGKHRAWRVSLMRVGLRLGSNAVVSAQPPPLPSTATLARPSADVSLLPCRRLCPQGEKEHQSAFNSRVARMRDKALHRDDVQRCAVLTMADAEGKSTQCDTLLVFHQDRSLFELSSKFMKPMDREDGTQMGYQPALPSEWSNLSAEFTIVRDEKPPTKREAEDVAALLLSATVGSSSSSALLPKRLRPAGSDEPRGAPSARSGKRVAAAEPTYVPVTSSRSGRSIKAPKLDDDYAG